MNFNILDDNVFRLLRKFAIPAYIGLFFQSLYTIFDAFFAGKTQYGLESLSLVFPLFLLIIGISHGVTIGFQGIFGKSFGKMNRSFLRKSLVNTFYIVIGFSIIISIFGIIISPFFISIMTDLKVIHDTSLIYIEILFFGTVTFTIPGYLNILMIAVGEVKTYRNTLIIGLCLSIILNYIFIIFFNLDIKYIAVTNIFINIIESIYLLYRLFQINQIKSLDLINEFKKKPTINHQMVLRSILAYINNVIFSITLLIYTYYLNSIGAQDAIVGFTIAVKIEMILILPARAISGISANLIIQNLVVNDFKRVKEIIIKGIFWIIILLIIEELLFLVVRNPILNLIFTNNQDIFFANQYFNIELLILPFIGIGFMLIGMFRSISQPQKIFIIAILRQIIFPLLVIKILIYNSQIILTATHIYIIFGVIIIFINIIGLYFAYISLKNYKV